MDPTSILELQGAGGIASALSAFMGASAQQTSLRYHSQIDSLNATTSERSAQAALLAGQHQEQQVMLHTAQMSSAQTAGFASHGIDTGQGSAARTIASTNVMGQADANTVAANSVRQAWGYRMQGTNYANDALMKSSAANAISPVMAAGTSLLSSSGQVAQNWYMMSKAGVPGVPSFSQPAPN